MAAGRTGINYSYVSLLNSIKTLPKYVKSISDIGIDFSLVGKSKAVGVPRHESEDLDSSLYSALANSDATLDNMDVPYFSADYQTRVMNNIRFSSYPEIKFILEKICDEAISYDSFGYFCKCTIGDMKLKDEYVKKIESNFKRVYVLLNFHDGYAAWSLLYKWLIEGAVAFEIIYDNKDDPRRIIGFEELDPKSLIPIVKNEEYTIKIDGKPEIRKKKIRVWKHITVNGKGDNVEITLSDNQVIFISYNKVPGNKGLVSYVERLIRSFNLMRTMENTKVGWHVMNSQFRLKMILPVGSKTVAKAKQSLAIATNKYKEDLLIDSDSGEVKINGQPKINFGRNIVLPERNGQKPEIEGIAYNGPDLTNMDSVRYFERKLWRDSTLPYSRFDRENGGGVKTLFAKEGVPHDEIAFNKSINRFRSEFERIIKKPLYLQTVMDFPELKIDMEFKAKLGLTYESTSLFEEAISEEIDSSKIEKIKEYAEVTELDGTTPLYSMEYLMVNRYKLMSKDEWDENRKKRDEELKYVKKIKKIQDEDDDPIAERSYDDPKRDDEVPINDEPPIENEEIPTSDQPPEEEEPEEIDNQ